VKFELTDYQGQAASDVSASIEEAVNRFERSEKLTAISLSAPTAAGKTVIATAVIERLLFGDETTEPNPQTTVLWVTDDPNLNQQTKRKMLVSSNKIEPRHLVVVDTSLDQRTLDAGRIYFVHIQQLGKGATRYNVVGDNRAYSLWDTIGNTIAEQGGNFLLAIDEAHKGTRRANGGTITAQLIDGAGGKFPPAPVVLGISATPDRFVDAITKAGQRILDPVTVDPDAVRESGLIKDKILIKHPTESQPGDSTLLELAVADLKAFDELWGKYSAEQGEPPVKPVLVVQVRARVANAELTATLDTLRSKWNILDGNAIGHAFQEHTTLNLGPVSVRYIAPQNIQDDPHLRVVLFKEALTTGWDCPRAEVMLSFRTAQDYTYIAQLIGRMVRTPLARRIATDEVLNTVALYLPHYQESQVAAVVNGIESDESRITSRVEVNSVTCLRHPDLPGEVWKLLAETPTYTRPARSHRNEVSRLNALATLLVGCSLRDDAMSVARKHLTDTLAREAARLGSTLDAKAADFEQLDYQVLTVDLATKDVVKTQAEVAVNSRNINDLFRRARRLLGDAAAKWYWDLLCDQGIDPDEAKVRVAALADDPTVSPALEVAAKSLVDSWRNAYNSAINDLPDAQRDKFYNIWRQAKTPQQLTLILPMQITASDKVIRTKGGETVVEDVPRHPKHIYVNGKKSYPATLTGWEADVLDAELAKLTLVGWYRNPTAGTAALAVPYQQSGRDRTLYPDFIFIHDIDGEVVLDVVDPHRPNEADTAPKWLGLAEYGTKHGSNFRRILAVIKNDKDQLASLDLKNPDAAARLQKAASEPDIRAIFAELGGPY
jgi:type III restriction enzyme